MNTAIQLMRRIKMYKWKTTENIKKIQRHINKEVREMNKIIENDELWKGRFYVRQINRCIYKDAADDGWVYFRVKLCFTDKQTGKIWENWYDKSDFFGVATWRFWEDMNKFIIDICDVWREDPRPHRATSIDYRKENKNDGCNGKSK